MQQFDAASAAAIVTATVHEAVPARIVGLVGHGHHLAAVSIVRHVVAAILVVAVVEEGAVGANTLYERLEILIGGRCPAALGDGQQTRQRQVFQVVGRGHVFAPEGALHTRVVSLLRGGDV